MRPSRKFGRRSHSAAARLSLLLVPCFAMSCQDDAAKVSELLEQGSAYSDQQLYPEAIIEYRSLLQLDPNVAEAHYKLASAYLQTQQLQEAIWEFGEAVRLDPTNTDARLSLGALFLVFKKFVEVEEQARAVIELEPDNPMPYTLLGQALEQLEQADAAEAPYLKAVALDPETGPYLLILASYYSRQGNRTAAEPRFVQYAESFPSYESYTALGRFLAEDLSRDEEAQQALERALEVSEPDQKAAAYRNLANLHVARNRTDQAKQALQTAIDSLQGDPEQQVELIYQLARLLGRLGDPDGVTRLLEAAAEATPSDVKPHMLLARIRSSNRDIEGALAAIDRALATGGASSRPLLAKAEILIQDGFARQDEARIAEGTAIVEQALANEPSDSNALFVQAKLSLAQQDGQAAVTAASAALDSRPNWAQAHFVLGQALAMAGNASGARAEVARAVELDPSLVDARRTLAGLHASLGEHEYAVEQGRIVLLSRPEDTEARLLVAQSLAQLGRTAEALATVPKDDDSAEMNFAQGRLLLAEGKLDEALAALLQANQKSPHHPEILRLLLGIEARVGKLDQSGARIEAAVATNPENSEFARLRGTYALLQEDKQTAKQMFERAIALDPTNLAAYEQLAQLHQDGGRWADTVATYQRAIEQRPEAARLHHFLATLYEMQDRNSEAMAAYERAIALDDDMPQSKNNLAYLLAESGGDLDRALNLAQEAKALMPESPNAADTLGWVLYRRGIPSAAVGYLREALAGLDADSPQIGMVRQHLALAYEANDQKQMAIDALELSLTELDKQQQKIRAEGGTPEDPAWSRTAREMLQRLKPAG
jgi:tetratricopeptide (TPR) repeat protein